MIDRIKTTIAARKKAIQSPCRYKIAAIGLNSNGDIVVKKVNRNRFTRRGGGIHAEMAVLAVARRFGVRSIILCRVNRSGDFLPIEPCETCKRKADEMGIKIYQIKG